MRTFFIVGKTVVPTSIMNQYSYDDSDDESNIPVLQSYDRRQFIIQQFYTALGMSTGFGIGFAFPESCLAESEIGTKINKAVTESELGLSVRKSVVQGAQIMDTIDRTWEQFSDRFNLGYERSKQIDKRPTIDKKIVSQSFNEFDTSTATTVLDICDTTFVSLSKIPLVELQKQIDKISATVGPSFVRSGLQLNDVELATTTTSTTTTTTTSTTTSVAILSPVVTTKQKKIENPIQFNYASYVHFKAYSDLLINKQRSMTGTGTDFRSFKYNFEYQIGQKLTELLVQVQQPTVSGPITSLSPQRTGGMNTGISQDQQQTLMDELVIALQKLDSLCEAFVTKGFIANFDRSTIDDDSIVDWANGRTDLSFSIAIDGDTTLQSQILLQEQGLRLYPNFIRYGTLSIVQNQLKSLSQSSTSSSSSGFVSIEDYYLDPEYNSDPNKFEVKEVLINIEIEGP